MAEQARRRPPRGYAASRFDEVTLAAFAVLLFVTVATVFIVGVATAEERIGCGLNDAVNALLAYPRACR